MTQRYRVVVSSLQLAHSNRLDTHLFQAAFEKLEKALGGPITNIHVYQDVMTDSYVIEAEAAPRSQVSLGAINWTTAYSNLSAATTQFFPQQYPTHRPVYLSSDDEYSHPDRPESMWSTQPVLGWRVFAWEDQLNLLMGYRQTWKEPAIVAECLKHPHRAPDWDCECGIYLSTGPPFDNGFGSPMQILAQVEATGLVIEHEFGWRAERVEIKTLWVSSGRIDEVRQSYPDVTVIPWRRS